MMEAEVCLGGEDGAWEGEQRRMAEERDIKMSGNGVSSFSSAWGKLQLQWEAPEDAQTVTPCDDANQSGYLT